MKIKARKKISPKILIDYCLIFIIPVILYGIISYINIITVSQRQDKEYDIQNLVVEKNSLDSNLLNIKKALEQAANRKWAEECLYNDENLLVSWDKNSLVLQTAIKDLQSIKNSVKGIERIGIFFKGSGMIIDNTYAYNPVEYYKNVYKVENVEIGKWFSLMDSFNNFNVLFSNNVLLNNKAIKGMTFFKTIPPNNTNSKGLVFCLVNQEMMNNTVNSLKLDNHSYGVIIDDSNKIIAASDNFKKEIPLLPYTDYTEMDYKNPQIPGSYIYYSSSISFLSWKLVLIRANKHFYEYFNISPYLLLILAIVLIVGIIVSYVLLTISNRPVERLFNLINLNFSATNLNIPSKKTKSGYVTIKNIFDNMRNNEVLYQNTIELCSSELQKNFLHCILGRIDENSSFKDLFEEIQHNAFLQNSSFVLIMSIDSDTSTEVHTKINNAFNRYLEKHEILFSQSTNHDFSRSLMYLIMLDREKDSYPELTAHLVDFKNQLEEKHNAAIQIVFGESCFSAASLHDSYKNNYYSTSQVLPILAEKDILKNLKTGEYEKVEGILNEIMKTENPGNPASYAHESEMLFYEVISVIIKFFEDEKKSDIPVKLPDFSHVRNLEDVISLIKVICKDRRLITGQVKNTVTGKDLKSELITFIDNNYLDHSMCQKLIKEKYNISFALITKIVKERTGYGFLEYLNKMRIEHSKKLLAIPSMSITKVCHLSGFNDDGTFIKTFKKYENTTPSGYRQNIIYKQEHI